MSRPELSVDLPLLNELRRLQLEAAKTFPHPYLDAGLGAVGLILDRILDESRYEGFTPVNCRTFARTGGEGVHFALIVRDGRITDRSPVLICIPQLAGQCYIVGENLFDFLCLGKDHGFFRLEQLGYSLEETLSVYAAPVPSVVDPPSATDADEDHKQAILEYLSSRLNLRPWGDAHKFDSLQERFGDSLEYPGS